MRDQLIAHSRNREYMTGIERDASRIKATSEVFTPTPLVQHLLDTCIDNENIHDNFLDPSCGDGQILSEVIIRKMENGSTYEQALNTTYGVDLMLDNCIECIKRLYMCEVNDITPLDQEETYLLAPDYHWASGIVKIFWVDTKYYKGIAKIICADGLKYDYGFGTYIKPVKTAEQIAKEAKEAKEAERLRIKQEKAEAKALLASKSKADREEKAKIKQEKLEARQRKKEELARIKQEKIAAINAKEEKAKEFNNRVSKLFGLVESKTKPKNSSTTKETQ